MKTLAILLALQWLARIVSATGNTDNRELKGYNVHDEDTPGLDAFPTSCQEALMAPVLCDQLTRDWTDHTYHGILNENGDYHSICDIGCYRSLRDWRTAVNLYCDGYTWEGGAAPDVLGAFISYAIEEVCQTEKDTGVNCNDIILNFSDGDAVEDMPDSELCSDCFLSRLKMMQASPYSVYSQVNFYQEALQAAVQRCGLVNQPTATHDSPFPPPTSDAVICLSGLKYTTEKNDTCDSIALKFSVSSAAIIAGNAGVLNCHDIDEGLDLCMPLPCRTYVLQEGDTLLTIRSKADTRIGAIRRLNPWIKRDYSNLHSAPETLGRVLCVSEPGGEYEFNATLKEYPSTYSEYGSEMIDPPQDAVLAESTNMRCGRWYTAEEGDRCGTILTRYPSSITLFTLANPTLSIERCSEDLVPGLTYCAGPIPAFLAKLRDNPQYHRQGCYAYDTALAGRTVLQSQKRMPKKEMTLLRCLDYCLRAGQPLFGLRGGESCLCNQRLPLGSVRLDDDKCNTKCDGDSTDPCGDIDTIEVYSMQPAMGVETERLGCFASTVEEPILSGAILKEVSEGMSTRQCGSFCTQRKHPLFALSEGTICTCGDELRSEEDVGQEKCRAECSDGSGYHCGGKGFAEVYSTQPWGLEQIEATRADEREE